MKNILLLILCLATSGALAQQYEMNPEMSKFDWVGYGEIGDFKQSGTIQAKSGTLALLDGSLTSAVILLDMRSISHDDKTLKKHLKGKDFFYTRKYPTAQLELTSVDCNQVLAEITIRDKTLPVSFLIDLLVEDSIVLVKGQLTLDRTLFDIKYNSSSYFQDLGNYAIKNEFDVLFELQFELSD